MDDKKTVKYLENKKDDIEKLCEKITKHPEWLEFFLDFTNRTGKIHATLEPLKKELKSGKTWQSYIKYLKNKSENIKDFQTKLLFAVEVSTQIFKIKESEIDKIFKTYYEKLNENKKEI